MRNSRDTCLLTNWLCDEWKCISRPTLGPWFHTRDGSALPELRLFIFSGYNIVMASFVFSYLKGGIRKAFNRSGISWLSTEDKKGNETARDLVRVMHLEQRP